MLAFCACGHACTLRACKAPSCRLGFSESVAVPALVKDYGHKLALVKACSGEGGRAVALKLMRYRKSLVRGCGVRGCGARTRARVLVCMCACVFGNVRVRACMFACVCERERVNVYVNE